MINSNENKPNRAGRYVRQPAGYRTFIPAPLPPDRPLDLRGPLRDRLSQADYALGRLDGAVLTLPNADLFVFMYVRKEAVLSSQIEGTQSSLQNPLAARPAHPQRGHGARVAGADPAGTNQIVARLEGIGLLREITGYARTGVFASIRICSCSRRPRDEKVRRKKAQARRGGR